MAQFKELSKITDICVLEHEIVCMQSVWCAASACKIMGSMGFESTINSDITFVLTQFFRELKEEKVYGYLMQYSTAAHKANFSVAATHELFSVKLITQVLWPRFP